MQNCVNSQKICKGICSAGYFRSAKENAEIMRKLVKLIHQHADAMEKETGVESSMLDYNGARRYLDLVIMETRGKKDAQ